ncbi:MAG TPA: hydroxyacid-oxoacid transhydrogenase, partial [Actinomycetes bacterium]|nr:hydroxyacid-oxoacid transhydrogenase [Actinomycetes bacterium]
GVHVEPTDVSLTEAVEQARASGPWDAFVAVGGGSSIDTAKAVDLLATNPGELLDYVNRPVGEGRAPSRPLDPLVAVPTTTGTGAESTTICVLDVLADKVKTGISHPRLRPTLAVVDPALTVTQPAAVTAASGMDVLCHALESWTAKPYTAYERKRPEQRVPYCGANPISDLWSEQALRLLADSFRDAVRDGDDLEARGRMALAATMAGLGFGNAGVHIPHANAYPIAGRVKDFRPGGYPGGEPIVPHGMAVSLTAPEAFRFTFEAHPERHLRAAELLVPGLERPGDDAEYLPAALIRLMRDVGIPNGIGGVGYDEADVPDLAEGAMKQQRLLDTAPRPVTEDDVAAILTRSLSNW